jgi:hypothetical protein
VNYSKVINAVFNPNLQMPCAELYKGPGSEVYRVDTPEPLVVRVAHVDKDHFMFQAELMEAIGANDEITPRILYWEMKETARNSHGIQVQSYLPGAQLDHYPSLKESKAIVKAVYTIHQRLCDVSHKFRPKTSATADEVLKRYFSKVYDCPIKAGAKKLVLHKRYNELFASEKQYLSHFDLWPKNLLIEREGDVIKVRIIDFDTIFGPKILQPAILFSSCFLVSSLMFRSEYLPISEMDRVIEYWPEPFDRLDLLMMMQIFPIVIGLKAEYTFKRFPEYTQERHNSNIRLLMGCLNNIWEWL